MKLSHFVTAVAIATEACSATPRVEHRAADHYEPRVGAPRYAAEPAEVPKEHSEASEKTTPNQPAETSPKYRWGVDPDQDQKKEDELAEIIAAFSVQRYSECIFEALEKREANGTNSQSIDDQNAEDDRNCPLALTDEDTKEILTEDIPANIQREIRAKAEIVLDEFRSRIEAQRKAIREQFQRLEDAIKDSLNP